MPLPRPALSPPHSFPELWCSPEYNKQVVLTWGTVSVGATTGSSRWRRGAAHQDGSGVRMLQGP